MQSNISPSTIQTRADAISTKPEEVVEDKAVDVKVDSKPSTINVDEKKEPDTKVDAKKADVKVAEVKTQDKPETPKIPNDPAELRKWNTKISQDNAALRDEMKALKVAIEKLTKKPIDYKELAKNPEAIQKQIELERQEAIAEMQDQLQEKATEATKNETIIERMKRERDTENYPRWDKLFPLIQTLAANADGRINWNQAPGNALDEAYALAERLSPTEVVVPAAPAIAQVAPGKSPEEIAALEAAAEKRGFEKAQAALRDEQNGAGIGSAGKGGRRSSATSKEALQSMPLGDLKKLISQE